jgi:hypothetical protein
MNKVKEYVCSTCGGKLRFRLMHENDSVSGLTLAEAVVEDDFSVLNMPQYHSTHGSLEYWCTSGVGCPGSLRAEDELVLSDIFKLERYENPENHKYDSFVVDPVCRVNHGDGEYTLEPTCEANPEIHCWSIYAHRRNEAGIDCIADCASKATAGYVANALSLAYLKVPSASEVPE